MTTVNIGITGYYATGSSALIDLLSEYSDVRIASPILGDYEHVPFYISGGLFDLGAILLNNCSPYNSDSAINNFIMAARRLNDNNFGWFGSYNYYFGDDRFIELTNKLVSAISTSKDRVSANHAKSVKFSLIRALLQIGAKIIYGRNIPKLGRKYIYDGNPMYFSMPEPEEFYRVAKEYTEAYMAFFKKNEQISVFDHLLWPQHAQLISEYFNDNFKLIIVNRDPRDIYVLNKYFLHKIPISTAKPYFPINAEDFIEEWRRTVTTFEDNANLLNIYFEDLIYDYDSMCAKIEKFIGISEKDHVREKTFFVPEHSIENTQTFLVNGEWENEVKIIARNLDYCCYKFPYKRVPDKNKWFDTPDNASRRVKKMGLVNQRK